MPALLFLALIASASVGMLVWVNAIVKKHGRRTRGAVAVCFFLSGATHICVMYYLPLLTQGLLLALALPLAWIPTRGGKVYRATSTGIVAAIWIVVAVNFVMLERQYREWQDQNPFESMEERVPAAVRGGSANGPMWSRVEEMHDRTWNSRPESLATIHADRVQIFHRAAGFGSLRMRDRSPKAEHFGPDLTPPVPQPERYDPNAVSLGEDVPDALRKPFPELHANSLIDFAYPDGFGYVRNRQEVAGFRPHRFSKVPDPVGSWEVRRVELVGLLLKPSPTVYISENLPRMADVKSLPTREPDSFEAEGLKAVRGGGDLYARGDDRDARMVGAIRSVNECVRCHGGERGDLLGAFSYRLRREAK